jgi:CHAD domain-containing protein
MNRPTTLSRVLDRRTRALLRYLPGAMAGDDKAVHQSRVASRRLREAVPVLAHGLHGARAGKARRKIRRVTRALGIVRELDVTIQMLDQLGERPGTPRPALGDVRAHVLEERERRRAVMLERLKEVDAAKLTRRLHTVRNALMQPGRGNGWRQLLGSRIAKRAKRLSRAIQDAGQIYAPEPLHRVRIATKKLRYALELAGESRAAHTIALVRTLKRGQDLLGRLHDLQVLQHHVADVAAAPQAPHARGAAPDAGLGILSRLIEDDCRHLHARYIAMLPALTDAAERAAHDVAIRVGVAPRSRPVKMEARPVRAAANGSGRRRPAGARR